MRKSLPLLCALLLCTLILVPSASAAYEDFTDVSDHWADETLRQAYEDGVLQGFEDGTLRPDQAVTKAELVTLLTRMVGAEKTGSVPGIPGDAWYSEAARRAAYIGLIEDGFDMDKALTRLEAFRLVGNAFQIHGSLYQSGDLAGFTDLQGLSNGELAVLYRLYDRGYLQGHGGLLSPNSSLTRAELVTILYRVIPQRLDENVTDIPASGGAIVGGAEKLTLKDQSFTNLLWLDCTTTALELNGTQAGTITLLSHKLESLRISGGSSVEMLVLSGGDGTALTVSPGSDSSIETLVIGNFKGAITVEGEIKNLVLAGDYQTVTLNSAATGSVTITGSASTLATGKDAQVNSLTFASYALQNTVSLQADLARLNLDGTANTLKLDNVTIAQGEFRGTDNRLEGTGGITAGTLYDTRSFTTDHVAVPELADRTDPGIEGIAIVASCEESYNSGSGLTLTAAVTNPVAKDCTVSWYFDGALVNSQPLTVGPEPIAVSYFVPVKYSQDMQTDRSFRFVVSYTNQEGETKTASADAAITLEFTGVAPEVALATVTSRYIGDYTTAWAENNDYAADMKTARINAKGHSSNTDYLIWINLTYQRVNIFQGSQGDWTLVHEYLCGSGRNGHNTPVGFYTVTNRSAAGWTHSTYNVRPVVNFTNSRYYDMAFHSRKYNPSHTYLTDPSIGFPVSLGCIRMYDEDVQWIYDNIPNGTMVVVH